MHCTASEVKPYSSPLMDDLYHDWTRIEAPPKMAHSVKQIRTEVLWVNYAIPVTDDP
jgi:DNA adenine methylase